MPRERLVARCQTRANNAILSLGPSGDITAHVDQGSGSVHLIIDVNGYFQ